MSTRVLVVAATELEIGALKSVEGIRSENDLFFYGDLLIEPLATGPGIFATTYWLKHRLNECGHPNLAINIGIAGSYGKEPAIGSTVVVRSDLLGDTGIESDVGTISMFEAGLSDPMDYPFNEGRLVGHMGVNEKFLEGFTFADAITVNRVTTKKETIKWIQEKYNPGIETMEGAAFSYICAVEKIHFLALRSVSNLVGERDKSFWNIPLAIDNLTLSLKNLLDRLE
jgi:futalosine hydrolase